MHPNNIQNLAETNYPQLKINFLRELTNASLGQPSSLSFIKHILPQKPMVQHGIVQGIVIGGTSYIFQTVQIVESKIKKVLHSQTGTLPRFATKDMLVNFLSEHLDYQADAIGVNFGFPLDPVRGSLDEIDGQLNHGTKEHTFTGLTEPIGSIIKALLDKEIPVSVANDTVCLALAGDGSENGSLIAGTGINAGIKMISGNQTTVINLEIGNFNKFAPSTALKYIDNKSEKPGEQLFEKAISGKYLALYFNERAKELGLSIKPLTTSQELSALSLATEQNDQTELAQAILTNSAFLLATALAGIYEFCGKPKQFTFLGEGSMLWHGWNYKENITTKLATLEVFAPAIEIEHMKDSSIKGAIGLVIS